MTIREYRLDRLSRKLLLLNITILTVPGRKLRFCSTPTAPRFFPEQKKRSLMEFKDFQFHPLVAAGVKASGYDEPTPIQVQGIPSVMQGREALGLGQTGT